MISALRIRIAASSVFGRLDARVHLENEWLDFLPEATLRVEGETLRCNLG